MSEFDAVVVGAGPNGLAAAITLAEAGCRVLVLEERDTIGGGTRTAELTLPGFRHDICSAVHPLGAGSPFFRKLALEPHGLEWIWPELPLAHPMDDRTAIILERSVPDTSAGLNEDSAAYRRLLNPLVNDWANVLEASLGPLRAPRHPLSLLKLGPGLLPASSLTRWLFRGERARALLSGLAAHAMLPLEWATTAAFGLMLGLLAHAVGWPFASGGSQSIADALAAHLRSLGSVVETGVAVKSSTELPLARAYLFDVSPRSLLSIFGNRLQGRYRRALERFQYGQGVFKIDYALSDPVPWTAAAARRAGTVHLGGTMPEIAAAEREIWAGVHPERPFVLVAQPSLFDSTRAPAGRHTLWAYCHTPAGSAIDMSERIEAQIERFAPGFRDCVLARHTMNAREYERYNPNFVGGDINGGAQTWRQLFTRPVISFNPYATPLPEVFLCSASTPPGGGVHGMCGYHAARLALQRCFRAGTASQKPA